MRLSDVMGHAHLSVYAEVALVLFIAAFLGIVIWTFRPGHREEMDAMSRMPLEDDRGAAPAVRAGERGAAAAQEGGAR